MSKYGLGMIVDSVTAPNGILASPEIEQFFMRQTDAIAPSMRVSATADEAAKAEGVFRFSMWLQQNMPEVYANVLQTVPESLLPEFATAEMNLSGLAEDAANPSAPQTTWGDRIFSLIETILPQYAQYRTQQELLKVNIARAERGLSPIESADIAPQVRVGLTSDMKNLFMIGGGIVAAILLIQAIQKRRR